eukprot:205209-Ditylum_brightwellii.AAC.1
MSSTKNTLEPSDSKVSRLERSDGHASAKDLKPADSFTTSCTSDDPHENVMGNIDNEISPKALDFLSSFLSSYKSRDVLDEDEVLDVMTAAENAASQRIRRRIEDPTYDCCYSSDEDDYDGELWG